MSKTGSKAAPQAAVRAPIDVCLALPSYDGRRVNAIQMVTAGQQVRRIHYMTAQGSLLAHVFNRTLVDARKFRDAGHATHFCMLHDDIGPEMDWMRKLWDQYLTIKPVDGWRGVLSVVSPIKSPHMLTSTAVDNGPDRWRPRKLSLKEVSELPVTFNASHVGGPLLVNTGLLFFDLREPWVNSLVFTIEDSIMEVDGELQAVVNPEDWNMSRWLNYQGIPVHATRGVEINHYGGLGWSNQWTQE